MPIENLLMSNFQSDEYCENLTCFMKHELFDLIGKLGLEDQAQVPRSPGRCYVFRQEEIFVCTLIKLSHGLTHTGMSDMIASGNSVRWGGGDRTQLHNEVLI